MRDTSSATSRTAVRGVSACSSSPREATKAWDASCAFATNSDPEGVAWFYLSKTAQPLRLRSDRWQYRLFSQYTEQIPIPNASSAERQSIATLAERCNTLAMQRYQLEEAVRHRLKQTFGFDQGRELGNLNEKAQEWWEHPVNALGDALKTSFKLKRSPFASPTTADEWEPYLLAKRTEVE